MLLNRLSSRIILDTATAMLSSLRLAAPVLALLLTACAGQQSKQETSPRLDQSGALKVHPGLLGQPVPAELQVAKETPAASEAAPAVQNDGAALLAETRVHFDLRSAEVPASAQAQLAAHARKLADLPAARLLLEGHADERGSTRLNKELGLQRAEAVKKALTASGAPAERIKTVSYGETRPRAAGHDEAAWAENRRVELIYDSKD